MEDATPKERATATVRLFEEMAERRDVSLKLRSYYFILTFFIYLTVIAMF